MADGGDAERDRTRESLERSPFVATVGFVDDGPGLLGALRNAARRRPSLVVLDLPRADEVLAALKADPGLRRIPVVVLVDAGDQVRSAYDLGASSCIPRPESGEATGDVLERVAEYWSRVVTLPDPAYG